MGPLGRPAPQQAHAVGYLTRILFFAAWAVVAGLDGQSLHIQVWQLDCSRTDPDEVFKALSATAKIFEPCGIKVEFGQAVSVAAKPEWCELPATEFGRKPLLKDMAYERRLKNLRGLSVFVLPSSAQARHAFSVIDESKGAGCGSPRDARFLGESGSIFITDFGLAQDLTFSASLIAHEIAHELTMKQHPTGAARGHILADHIADYGPKISKADCACMRQSPFLHP